MRFTCTASAAAARDEESRRARGGNGVVHGAATGGRGRSKLALGFSLVWSGPGIKGPSPRRGLARGRGRADAVSRSGSAPTATGATHPRNSDGSAIRVRRARGKQLLAVDRRALRTLSPGRELRRDRNASFATASRRQAIGSRATPIAHGVVRPRATSRRTRQGGRRHGRGGHGARRFEHSGLLGGRGGRAAFEDNFLSPPRGREGLLGPDGVVRGCSAPRDERPATASAARFGLYDTTSETASRRSVSCETRSKKPEDPQAARRS